MALPKTIALQVADFDGPNNKVSLATIFTDTDQLQHLFQQAARPASDRSDDLRFNMRWPEQDLCNQNVSLLFFPNNSIQICRVRKGCTTRTVRVTLDTLQAIAESSLARKYHLIGASDKFAERVIRKGFVDRRFCWECHYCLAEGVTQVSNGW